MEFRGRKIRRVPEAVPGPSLGTTSCKGCKGCVGIDDTRPAGCNELPECGIPRSIFIYDTEEAWAEYIALKLDG